MYKKAFELSYKNKKVEIEIQDFTGTVRNINGTEDLFSLSYISDSKDKGQSILVTEADINFYADDYFNIDELKTVGETDIKVKYYEDDSLLWSGFVIPDFFSTSVDITPVVSMVATDRIGTLKEISNNAESNIPIQILASCLKQTGQDLPINLIIGNNHFETPIQLERIEEIASYDVIRTFMVLFNCKITLYKNAWWVVNKKLLESGFVNYKSYNSDGAGGSVTPFAQPILDIDLVGRDGQREIKPTASEISLFLEFGGSKKYPDNWNFTDWNESNNTFVGWYNHNEYGSPMVQRKGEYYIDSYVKVADKDYSWDAVFSERQLNTPSLWSRNRYFEYTYGDRMDKKPQLRSPFAPIRIEGQRAEVTLKIDYTMMMREDMYLVFSPIIRIANSDNSTKRWWVLNNEGGLSSAGNKSQPEWYVYNSSDYVKVAPSYIEADDGLPIQQIYEQTFDIPKEKLELSVGGYAEIQFAWFGYFEPKSTELHNWIDVFLHSAEFMFNKSQVTGKGLIFKIKQGGEKFSKSREPETILFSDKINQGVNGHFYNYKYDDTSIVDLPSEFALSSVRERADMFSKARDYYSLNGNFIVNPLAKYTCGLKSFVLIGGQNRREDAGIIVEEIVSNTLNRTDFIYTYFDDGKDKVKSIGTASGGSSSGGGGGAVSSPQLWKVDEDGNIYTEYNAYSLKELSAFGFEEGQDGGVIINVIDSLTSTSKTDALSANQGRYLKTLIDNIEVGEGGQVIVDWEAITGKPDTFVPSAHTHIIGDVTGLQGALDDKASLSQLDDKEDKFTKSTAFNKNFGTGLNDVARGNHTHTFASLTSIPTTLSGYGITDAYTKTNVNDLLSNKADEATKITAGTGLTGGGTLASDRTLSVNFGTTAGTVTQGNDSRLSDARTPLAHSHAISGVTGLQTALDSKLNKLTFDDLFEKVETSTGKWAVKVKYNLFSVGEISAFGASESEGGGGGGSMNMMQAWSTSVETENYYLPAKLAVPFYNNTRDRLTVLEAGTAPASHTHPISDITNLQTTLDDKADITYVDGKVKTDVPLNAKFTDTIVDISGKVDKKTGFSLVADTEISRLSGVTNQDLSSYAKTSDVNTLLLNKVDKVTGKSLISDTEITRLSSVTNQDLTPYALKTYVDTEVGKKWTYSEATIKAVKVSNAFNSDTVNGFTVGVDVPDNAKFTDTIIDISGKVDKVTGKGLSTNDFTTVEKNKLAILENQTRESLGVENVTNESKETMLSYANLTEETSIEEAYIDYAYINSASFPNGFDMMYPWKIKVVNSELHFIYNNVVKFRMLSDGSFVAAGGVTAFY